MHFRRLFPFAVAALALAGCGGSGGLGQSGPTFYGLGQNNVLVQLEVDPIARITSERPITGLRAQETMVDIDVDPADGQLYGTSDFNAIYRINPDTGAVTAVNLGPIVTPIQNNSNSIEFQPNTRTFRMVSTATNQWTVNANNGMMISTHTALNYGDNGPDPRVASLAVAPNTAQPSAVTIYGFDSERNQLVRIGGVNGNPSPNGGLLTAISTFNPAGAKVSLDVRGTDDFAILSAGNAVFRVPLNGGNATPLGLVSRSLVAIAARP